MEFTRGVSPRILIQQIKNTADFIFSHPIQGPHFDRLRAMDKWLTDFPIEEPVLSHVEYFALCLAAHHATVATFVPTDVDNQIRQRLWHQLLSTDELEQMADVVLESHEWDYRPVSTRWVASKKNPEIRVSGHHGEWFSTAAGAYGALRKRSPEKAQIIADAIIRELQKEADLYQEFRDAKDGISLLMCSTLIAHNLGDLDRVIDMWNIGAADPLKIAAYKAGHVESDESQERRFRGDLLAAGQVNKALMAVENHRHFALRIPRALRKSANFVLPLGPFFDAWGAKIASDSLLTKEEKASVAEALIDGWEKLGQKNPPGPVGYTRALAGMLERFPGGPQELSHYLPAKLARTLKAGPLRTLCVIPQRRFEEQWNQTALKTAAKFGAKI